MPKGKRDKSKGEKERLTAAVRAAVAAAGRRKDSGERSVFIQTEKQRDNDGQTAAAKNVRAEKAVFRAEHEQRNKNPKGAIPR